MQKSLIEGVNIDFAERPAIKIKKPMHCTYSIDGEIYPKYVNGLNHAALDIIAKIYFRLQEQGATDQLKMKWAYVDTLGISTILRLGKYRDIRHMLKETFGKECLNILPKAARRKMLFLKFDENRIKSQLMGMGIIDESSKYKNFGDFLQRNNISIFQNPEYNDFIGENNKSEAIYWISVFHNLSVIYRKEGREFKKYSKSELINRLKMCQFNQLKSDADELLESIKD